MAKFVYNNVKNAIINYIKFELNYVYHFCMSLKKKANLHLIFELINK